MSVGINIEFETECGRCYGNGYLLANGKTDTQLRCDRCNGSGRAATELGRELLEFLEHHGIKSIAAERTDRNEG